jgi:hypothetical protein
MIYMEKEVQGRKKSISNSVIKFRIYNRLINWSMTQNMRGKLYTINYKFKYCLK